MFIQLIFILFGLIQTEFVQQEFSPLPELFVCAEYHCEDCGVFYVTTNIENIKVGDYVLAQDVETGEVSLKEVTDTIVRTSNHLRYLTTVDEEGDTQTIETTDAHPFWVVTDNPDLSRAAGDFVVENGTILYHENLTITEHGYYVEAKDLKIGDVFIGANGELTTLTGTERVEFPNGVTVYNFSVADNHNYYVIANLEAYENGASVVLVHNAKCGPEFKKSDPDILCAETNYPREDFHILKKKILTAANKDESVKKELRKMNVSNPDILLNDDKVVGLSHPNDIKKTVETILNISDFVRSNK